MRWHGGQAPSPPSSSARATAATRLQLLVLIQAAIGGSVDDQITNHAEDLFAELDERGRAAWQETALLLIQHLLSSNEYGEGEAAAQRYLAEQPPRDQQPLTLATLHQATAAFISGEPGGGRVAAERLLAATRRQGCA